MRHNHRRERRRGFLSADRVHQDEREEAEFASFEECANRCLVEDADRFVLLDNIPMLRLEGSS